MTQARPVPLALTALVALFSALAALAVSGGMNMAHAQGTQMQMPMTTSHGPVRVRTAAPPAQNKQMSSETRDRLQDVVEWRRLQLGEAGFEPEVAARLAEDPRYDVHALIELVEHGCPATLATRILAPLEEGAGA